MFELVNIVCSHKRIWSFTPSCFTNVRQRILARDNLAEETF